jgi:phage shock protein PspC (stress-responsive transcriptional regulator)
MDYEFPLFLHIIGAMGLLGALLLAATALATGPGGARGSLRLGFRALLLAALPSYVIMRVGAQWTESESGLGDLPEEPAWVDIGYITGELGLLLLIIATVCAGVSLRRGDRPGLTRTAFILSVFMVVMYIVTIWAMTTKPE